MSCLLKNRLAECRAAKGINKSQLAIRLKMSRAYVTRLERGDIQPSFESALRIAHYFGKPVEQIFQLVEEAVMASPAKGLPANNTLEAISRSLSATSGKV
jgi:putative transcriptional regulator